MFASELDDQTGSYSDIFHQFSMTKWPHESSSLNSTPLAVSFTGLFVSYMRILVPQIRPSGLVLTVGLGFSLKNHFLSPPHVQYRFRMAIVDVYFASVYFTDVKAELTFAIICKKKKCLCLPIGWVLFTHLVCKSKNIPRKVFHPPSHKSVLNISDLKTPLSSGNLWKLKLLWSRIIWPLLFFFLYFYKNASGTRISSGKKIWCSLVNAI